MMRSATDSLGCFVRRIVAGPGIWLSLLLAVVGLGLLVLTVGAASEPPGESVVARLYVRDRDHLAAVADQLDIWEVHYEAGFALVAVTPEQMEWLRSLGYRLEVDQGATAGISAVQAPLDPRYHYFDDDYANANGRYVVDFLQDVNTAYPTLTELIDIGDAWQAGHGGYHRDLWVLRISNEDVAYGDITQKPAFFLLATIHAREVAVPELAIRYIQYLTSGYNGEGGYGLDPDVTWLVDHQVAYILVMANPDGHRVNEADTSAYRRKNMDNDDGCLDSRLGVDLNRNHSFYWNQGGSSGEPCGETYRGPSAASEPETQAFQNYFASVMRDQNGPNGDYELPLAAPDDASGLFISLHSYGDLVLWPWGHTYTAAPNGSQLRTIGRKFAYYNHYEPQQGSALYPVSGSTDDWTYGKFGVASFTFEVGPGWPSDATACEGFFPAYECIDGPGADNKGNFWPENRPAFVYAHKIARTPYQTAQGPDAVDVAFTLAQVPQGAPAQLTATIDDERYSQANGTEPSQVITAAEYYIDVPPWVTSTTPVSYPLTAVDGAFDETSEVVQALVDTSALAPGRHLVFVRGRDADGNWGAFTALFLTVTIGSQPELLDLAAWPPSVPIVHGQATVTATLTLSDGTPAQGWPVTFTLSLGTVLPPLGYADSNGHAVVTLYAGGQAGEAEIVAQAPGLVTGPVTVTLYIPDPPVAGFTSTSPVCMDSAVRFTNTSTAPPLAPASYRWAFGDGGVSTKTSPQHSYAAAGSYTVTLTASNAGGASVYSDTVEVRPLPEASWTYTPTLPLPGQVVQFLDQSAGAPGAWSWDFGDGGLSSQPSPTHTFATTDTYTVTLRVSNDCGWSAPQTQAIVVGGASSPLHVYLPLILVH